MSKGFDTNAPKELLERCCHEGSHLGKGMLSSALQTVGGNTALALLLTVSSTLLGIFTMPFILCTADCGRQHSASIAADSLLQPAGHLHNAIHTVSASGSLRLSSHHEARAPPGQSAEDYISTSAGGSSYSQQFPW